MNVSKRTAAAGGAAVLALLCCLAATAREPDGTLGLIRTPNNGVPVLTLPGGAFDAIVSERADLSLTSDSGAACSLNPQWHSIPGAEQARCTLPPEIKPGTYALTASTANKTDVNARSVYVFEAFPESYLVAHVTDIHIGSQGRPRPADAIFRDIIQSVNASGALFALLTGDLTDGGEPDQFRSLLEVMDTCTMPTFVCPGNHDRQALHYEQTFGPLAYYFWFGNDAYLSFDTKDFITADELGRQDADLEVYRRAIKPARWSIGFSHRYEPAMGMRSQIVLFVDNPLDCLIAGHTHRANEPGQDRVPWGTTRLIISPAAIDGVFRLIEITSRGIRVR